MQQVLQAENAESLELLARNFPVSHSQSTLLMRSINFAPGGLLQQVL